MSRTFTDGASVAPETRARVIKAAEALNYHVNHLARGLSKEESRPVCILVSTLRKPYHAVLLDLITTALQKAGRIAIVINVGASADDADQALIQTMNYRAAATIVLSGSPPARLVERCIGTGQKVILVNRGDDLPDVYHLRIDYARAMEQAAQLFHKGGHKNIAIVTRAERSHSLAERELLLQNALIEHRIKVNVWRGASTTYETGQAAVRDLFLSRNAPDGLFCINDLLACGAMDALTRELGCQVPADVAVLGFDDIPQASWQAYRLSTFAQPYSGIASTLAELLSTDEPERICTLHAELKLRGTHR
ncbi:LacI family DNA-binding transcriptional regulator [Yoonia maritima]|uniref:LacI family DNA-binding transcriptional regulator n=1 Tax=Yoonia maritima TaxID=1435347 RepID=UPI000D10CAC9